MTRSQAKSIGESKWTFVILLSICITGLIVLVPLYTQLPIPASVKGGFIIFMIGAAIFASVMLYRILVAWKLIRNCRIRRQNKVWKNL